MNSVERLGMIAPLFVAVLAGCGTSAESGPGAGGSSGFAGGGGGVPAGMGGANGGGGAGGAATPDCAHINYAAYEAMPAVSFKSDVMPILNFGCTLSSCHGTSAHKAGLVFGYRCNFDAAAKWTCTYPGTPSYIEGSTTEIDATAPQPYDPAVAAMARTSLLAPSTTVNGGAVMRVVPSHPESSFIMQKLADTENSNNYVCTNQDPAYAPIDSCGIFMPLNGEKWCAGKSRTRFDALAAWIAQGALDN